MSIDNKLALSIDPMQKVVTYQFLDVMSEAEVQQAAEKIYQAFSFFPAGSFVILADYRPLLSKDNEFEMKQWSKSGYAAFLEFRRNGNQKSASKIGVLAAAPMMKIDYDEFLKQLGYDKIEFIRVFWEDTEQATVQACYSYLGLSSNPLVDSVKVRKG